MLFATEGEFIKMLTIGTKLIHAMQADQQSMPHTLLKTQQQQQQTHC